MTRLDDIEARFLADPDPVWPVIPGADLRYLLKVARDAEALTDFLENGFGWFDGATPEFSAMKAADHDRLYELSDTLRAAIEAER